MRLKILGSGSRGNCYILENEREALILECGIRFSEIKKALDFRISKVVACLISHEHEDHSAYVNQLLGAFIPVWASAGTIGAMNLKSRQLPMILEAGKHVTIGSFKVLPFDTKHDSAEPLGFVIHHSETGSVLFATDTYYLPYRFNNLSNILIECNYGSDILARNIEAGIVPEVVRERTVQSHLSFNTCLEALLANDLSAVNNIVLIHLSDNNSNATAFREGIRRATGKRIYVAESGMVLDFNKTPF